MQLDAFDSFADTTIDFPLGQKTYSVAVPDFETGARITRVIAGEEPESKDQPQEWLWRLLLGSTFDEMIADRAPYPFIVRAGQTALQHFLAGRDAAVKMWREGPDPLAVRAALEAAQQNAGDSQPSTSTAGVTATRSPASSRATTSRKK